VATDAFTYTANDSLEVASSSAWLLTTPSLSYVSAVGGNAFGCKFTDPCIGSAIYATPIGGNHYSQIVVAGTLPSGTGRRRGVLVRATNGAGSSRSAYAAFIWNNGTSDVVELVRMNGLATPTTIAGPTAITYNAGGTTLRLEATGTGPVLLTVKVDGSAVSGMNALSDSTYQLTGTYLGICAQTEDAGFTGDTWDGDTITSTVRKLKCLIEPAAIGSTVRYGAVYEAPTGAAGSKVTGAKIGEFESVAFQTGSGADTGYAVLKVPVADFGGGALSTSDTPVVYLEDADESTYLFPATVIDE
jgi:hypothetical protein